MQITFFLADKFLIIVARILQAGQFVTIQSQLQRHFHSKTLALSTIFLSSLKKIISVTQAWKRLAFNREDKGYGMHAYLSLGIIMSMSSLTIFCCILLISTDIAWMHRSLKTRAPVLLGIYDNI